MANKAHKGLTFQALSFLRAPRTEASTTPLRLNILTISAKLSPPLKQNFRLPLTKKRGRQRNSLLLPGIPA
jgi:hypothetical protein